MSTRAFLGSCLLVSLALVIGGLWVGHKVDDMREDVLSHLNTPVEAPVPIIVREPQPAPKVVHVVLRPVEDSLDLSPTSDFWTPSFQFGGRRVTFANAPSREEAEEVAKDLRHEFQSRDGALKGHRRGEPGWAVNLWAATVVVVPGKRKTWDVAMDGTTVPGSHAVCQWLNKSWGPSWVENGHLRALWRPWTSRGLYRTCQYERTAYDDQWPG